MKKFIIFIIFITIITVITPLTFAQTTLPLIVYPARQFLELDPGGKTAVNVNFVNQSNQPLSGFIKVVDFIVRDNQGTPELIENLEAAPKKYAAASWFKTEYDRLTLPANEKVSIQASINIPQDANPGGRYVAVYFQAQDPKINPSGTSDYQAGTGIVPRLASLIYIKIKGDIKENAFVTKFQTDNFQEYGPIEVQTEILNQSDYHITPKGEIILKNPFGNIIDKKTLKQQNIFPDTSRSFQNSLGGKLMIGKYQLIFNGTYGEKGKVLTAYYDVWVFPWRAALILVLTLIVIYIITKAIFEKINKKTALLEKEIEEEKEEIEKLRQALKKRSD